MSVFKNISIAILLLTFASTSVGQEKNEQLSKLFVREGLQYSWNFEISKNALFNNVDRNTPDKKLDVEGKVVFENGLAKFYSTTAKGSFLRANIRSGFNQGLTLWMRFLLPDIKDKSGTDPIELNILEFEPFRLYLATSQKDQYRYGIGINMQQGVRYIRQEPSLQYNLKEGSWIQVVLLLFENGKDNRKAKLYYRLEQPNQDANNWCYIGQMEVPVGMQFANVLRFGMLEKNQHTFDPLCIDELRVYDRALNIENLGNLWPVYQDFNPNKNYPPGVVIDYSPAKTRRFIAGSPSIVMLDDGTYIAKGDDYGPAVGISELVRVYKSVDKGATWSQISEIEGMTWASMFVHKEDIYMLGTSAGHGLGHVVVIKSTDGGYTWSRPADVHHGKLISDLSYHTAPVPVVFHNGRIWRTMEDEKGPGGWGQNFRAFLMSAPLNADLLQADSWTRSNALGYDSTRLQGNFKGWLEGNTVLGPDGRIVNVLRVSTATGGGKAALITYSEDGARGTFDEKNGFIDFPGGSTKFHILYDEKTAMYWALSNAVPEKHSGKAYSEGMMRNTLVLMTSPDLVQWTIQKTLLYHPDIAKHSFQYPTFLIDGNDIVFVARTAYDDGKDGAYKQHDVNFFTFHRVTDFRNLLENK